MTGHSESTSVHAEFSGAMARDIEKQEAINNRQLALIHDGKEMLAPTGVDREVGKRHLAAGDERGHAGEQPQENERATPEFDDTSGQHQGNVEHGMTAERAEKFLRAMAQKEKSGNNAQCSESIGFQASEEFHRDECLLLNGSWLLSLNGGCASVEESSTGVEDTMSDNLRHQRVESTL
jgi:hypothetical protein